VNLPACDILIMIDCKSVSKIQRNHVLCVKNSCVFLESFMNARSLANNLASTPEVLCAADIS
jgi:hypothetical protein